MLYEQIEKITKLGVLIVLAFVVLSGIVLQDILSNDLQKEAAIFFCATTSYKEKPASNKLKGNLQEGKILFLEKCASCHNIDMVSDMIGPALSGAVDRWKNREDLYQWVQDYTVLIKEEHPRALQMEKWSPFIMTTFTNLDTIEIQNIFAYIEGKRSY